MRSIWNVLIVVLFLSSPLIVMGCGESSGAEQTPVDVEEDANTEDTAQDTAVDTTVPPAAVGPSRVGVVSGAAALSSDNYQLKITVGGPVISHRIQSSGYSMTLGVGATP